MSGNEKANVRLEAFCDGVFAIAITLLVIEIRLHAPESINTSAQLWSALWHMAPQIFAFILSFVIIFITWVNHHAALKLVDKSSSAFMYANGFLLLTVAFIPFPTALLGEFIGSDSAAPAVVLYNAVIALQGLAWVLLADAALRGKLTTSDGAAASMRLNFRHGWFAFALYGALAIVAMWLPTPVAIVTTATFAYWLVMGIRMKQNKAL